MWWKKSQAFEYVFSNIIDHINTICFIAKANDQKVDIKSLYTYNCVISLFAEDVQKNFIVLATHLNEDTREKGHAFIDTIIKDNVFGEITKKFKDKW